MRVNILKRLESSVYSFEITLSKILSQINSTLERIYEFETTHADDSYYSFDIKDSDIIDDDENEEMESLSV